MRFKSLLSSVPEPRRRPIRSAHRIPHRVRLAVEALEDRLAPATLGTYFAVEGPAQGHASVVLADTGAWTATSNARFLHLLGGSFNGEGNTVIQFSFDANSGATRTGTLTIAGKTFSVTQAGSNYVAASPVTTLISKDLHLPRGVAVDGAGNVYFSDNDNAAIREWNAATHQVRTLVPAEGIEPYGVAVDAAGSKVYFTDPPNNAVKVWNAATGKIDTLVDGLDIPLGVAVDAAGNVFIADTRNNAIKERVAATGRVRTLVSTGLVLPFGVAVDAAGNVYIANTVGKEIDVWNRTTGLVDTLVSTGKTSPASVAVDGAGDVYFSDAGDNTIKEWNGTTGRLSTLVSTGLKEPSGVAVDRAGNVYFSDTNNNAIKALTRAFVPGGPVSLGAARGSDQLLPVLPNSQSLTGVFAPSSDQSWLTLGASVDGVVKFSFKANKGPARTAHITILGESITVTQAGAPVAPGLT